MKINFNSNRFFLKCCNRQPVTFSALFLLSCASLLATESSTTLPQPLPAALPAKQTAIEQAGSPPASLNLADFPADSVEDVVVPVPSEIFGVLDKLGNPNWKSQLRLTKTHTPEERSQIALLLGSVIAEGFVAVEAEDAERVKDLGRDVLSLAEAVNVRKSVIARSKSIIEKADHRDWRGVRSEFDGARNDVQAAMDEMNDRNLAQLVSLGGWLRGTDVLTAIVNTNYTADGAELLHQPELVRYFKRCIGSMSPRLRKNSLVIRIDKLLDQIAPMIGEKNGAIPHAKIEKIHALTSEIVSLINTTP